MNCFSPSGRWLWTAGLGGAILFAVLPILFAGQEKPLKTATDESETRVLVLKSGRIVEGEISQNAGGFVVDKPNGSMLIPFEHVRLRAADRRDAFRKLRQTLPEGSPADHLKLARWCLTYQLYDECRSELRTVLEINRNHREARSMLRRLEEVLHPDKPDHKDPPDQKPRTEEGFEPQNATSLAGLSRKTARQFVTEVQPILLNTCGNASCHGSATKSEFRLVNVPLGRGSHRVFAERNLAQTLKLIDTDRPADSPLLVVPRENHGRTGQHVFHGPRAARQRKTVQQWVAAVAGELQTGHGTNGGPSIIPAFPRGEHNGTIRSRRASNKEGGQPSGTLIRGRSPGPSTETVPKPPATEDDLLEAVLRDERPDAFNPEIFNRIVHGSNDPAPP